MLRTLGAEESWRVGGAGEQTGHAGLQVVHGRGSQTAGGHQALDARAGWTRTLDLTDVLEPEIPPRHREGQEPVLGRSIHRSPLHPSRLQARQGSRSPTHPGYRLKAQGFRSPSHPGRVGEP